MKNIPVNKGIVEYETAYHWCADGFSREMKIMHLIIAKENIREKTSPEILDIGCGDGYMTNELRGAGRSITGVDASASGLKFAKELSAPGVRYLLADACNLPFHDNQFDVVTAFETIEHIEDDTAFVYEMRRVLRPDGIVIISTPNRQRLFGRRSKKHWREYTNKELRELMSPGFDCMESCGIYFYIPLLGIWPRTRRLLMVMGLLAPERSRGLFYVGRVK